MKKAFVFCIVLSGMAVIDGLFSATHAQWSNDPNVNNPVCTAVDNQQYPKIVSDGAGGAIITWEDHRNGNADIYAQHFDSLGFILWQSDGIPICTAIGSQVNPQIIADGNGGAVITWQDARRLTESDIYAERVSGLGIIQWAVNGIAICTTSQSQAYPVIARVPHPSSRIDAREPLVIYDFIVAWQDNRSDTSWDIYAQLVDASGIIRWDSAGVTICTASGNQYLPVIISDRASGAIISWGDERSGTNPDIYAQKITSSGAVLWTTNGVAVCTAPREQFAQTMTNDIANGTIITWMDIRDSANSNIYAQRIDGSGVPMWTYNGIAICTAPLSQTYPAITGDGDGGAYIAWTDERAGMFASDIYAQYIDGGGVAQWEANGKATCTAPGFQQDPVLINDGAGGVIAVWEDSRAGASDIYAQRINRSGSPLWKGNGIPVSTAIGTQFKPAITAAGVGAAIVTWHEYDRLSSSYDIYAQYIGEYGRFASPSPRIVQVRDVINDQGGKVTVMWTRSSLDTLPDGPITSYTFWRGVKPTPHIEGIPFLSRQELTSAAIDKNFPSPMYMKSPLTPGSSDTIYWEYITSVKSRWMIGYSCTVPTLSDSGPQGIPWYYFMITAQTDTPWVFWDSEADSGYSVDNLPPASPKNFFGYVEGISVILHWDKNSEPDFAYYEVYRSPSPNFDPDTITAIATTTAGTFTDWIMPPVNNYYYAVRAVDIHGNRSPKSNEVAIILVSVEQDSGIPTEFSLQQNYPNPFNPFTIFDFRLPIAGHVTLRVYDVIGREVATLVNEVKRPGEYTVRWDASHFASGVYFYRLMTPTFSKTKSMEMIK